MPTLDVQTFLAINGRKGAWGKADTLAAAVKNMRMNYSAKGKEEITVIVFSCNPEAVSVVGAVDLEYHFPRDAVALRFIAKI